MPTIDGLQRLIALWNRYIANEPKPGDAKEWWTLFGYLEDVRTWSAKDRIDPLLGSFIERKLRLDLPVRIELDLWFRNDPKLRAAARSYLDVLLNDIGGTLLDFATIDPIHYQAALVEIPVEQAQALRDYAGPIATADQIMKVRPQSIFTTLQQEIPDIGVHNRVVPAALDERPAIAALIDGYPIQNHALLANRVDVEEVDIAGEDVPVSRRFHGTAMASLILHGDLAKGESSLTRTL